MQTLKKALIASAVGMALASSAQAGLLNFDVNGAAGPNAIGVDRFRIDVFDWTPGNLLIKDTVPPGAVIGTDVVAYAQSALTGITRGGVTQFSYGGAVPGQLTYQLTLNLATAAAGAGEIKYSQGGATGTFNIFYNAASIASDISGCGFGAAQVAPCGAFPGALIYSGSARVVGSATLSDDGALAGILDQSSNGINNQPGVTTNELGLGTLRVNVDTTFFLPTFFLSDIASLSTDIQHTEQGGGAPFIQSNPSDQVVGSLPNYGGPAAQVNDFLCGGVAFSPCDIHLQSDASSTVLTTLVPEPGSLALLGLGFAALGLGVRRRSKSRA